MLTRYGNLHLEIQTSRKSPVGILRSSFRGKLSGKIAHAQHWMLPPTTRDAPTPELTFQGESSPGRHKFKCRFRVEKPLHMRVRSLGQLRVLEDPQPIGGVTADFADERRFKESPGYLPHHRRHHGGLPYRAWRIDLGTPRLEYKRLVDSKNHLRQSASSAVDLQPKGKAQ